MREIGELVRESVDKLAIKISQIEHIPLLTTRLDGEEIKARLGNI